MIKRIIRCRFSRVLTASLALAAAGACGARAMETQAKQAYLVDMNTGSVLLEKNADVPVAPASMSKLMTVYMVFELLKDGRLSMDDKFLVSRNAWEKGGTKSGSSTMFLKPNSRARVEDLLRGIVIQSGNDACIVFAEGLAGSEQAFAEQMTKRARELGLKHSVFKNATGWPDPEHVMSVHDIALLAMHIIRDFPDYYSIFSEKTFTYNNIRQGNRNPLLYRDPSADGLKTGHTTVSGFGLVGSAKRGDRRVVLVLNGLPSIRARSSESLRLIDWAFRAFDNYSLFQKGDTVDKADVWLGTEDRVPLIVDRDVKVTLQRRFRRKMTAKIMFTGPIPAPIAKGAPIARLVVSAPEFKTLDIPLRAGIEVGQRGMLGRLGAAISYMLWGSS